MTDFARMNERAALRKCEPRWPEATLRFAETHRPTITALARILRAQLVNGSCVEPSWILTLAITRAQALASADPAWRTTLRHSARYIESMREPMHDRKHDHAHHR